MLTRVTFDAALRAQLLRLARQALPREWVAVLGGDVHDGEARLTELIPLANEASDDDAFDVDPIAFARAEHALAARGRRWLGFVHSHPRGSAAPSTRDRQQLWPHCLQLIVAPHATGHSASIAAFELRQGIARPLPIVSSHEAASA